MCGGLSVMVERRLSESPDTSQAPGPGSLPSVVTGDTRPLLIGMNNPQGNQPLWPAPVGCSGHRLAAMLRSRVPSVTDRDYLGAFDRANLVNDRVWDANLARQRARELGPRLMGRT